MGKLQLIGVIPVEHGKIEENRESCRKRGLPRLAPHNKRDGRLAVVGGGPSVLNYLNRIAGYSHILAINGACKFLSDHGIESTFFAIDPHEIVAKWAPGAKKALLCDRVCPEVFDILKDADVTVFELANDVPGGVCAGSSTASAGFILGPILGYEFVDFYGCESSFEGQSHAYMDEALEEILWVEVGGKEYKTRPDFYLQAQEMSQIFKKFPRAFTAYGGGLLQAMIDHDDHDVKYVSRVFMNRLKPTQELLAECQSS